jgi:predicted transcriptional regulator
MGSLETAVLEQLWSHPNGATPAEVHDALGADLAYTTVMTILARLWKKGLAEREPRGRSFAYRPMVSEAELAAKRMGTALEQTRDRRAALSQFVSGLSAKDERLLRKLLEDR